MPPIRNRRSSPTPSKITPTKTCTTFSGNSFTSKSRRNSNCCSFHRGPNPQGFGPFFDHDPRSSRRKEDQTSHPDQLAESIASAYLAKLHAQLRPTAFCGLPAAHGMARSLETVPLPVALMPKALGIIAVAALMVARSVAAAPGGNPSVPEPQRLNNISSLL